MPVVTPDLDDRERAAVERVLGDALVAYVAMVDGTNRADPLRPYVVPMNFAYERPCAGVTGDEGRLLLHTGPGRKVDALAADPSVCVSVISQEELRLGSAPCEDGFLYRSVILEGQAILLTDEVEREKALRAIVAKYDPGAVAKPFAANTFSQTLLYVVEVETIGFKERPKRS